MVGEVTTLGLSPELRMARDHAGLAHRCCASQGLVARTGPSTKQFAAEVQRTQGIPVQIRVGLDAGEVVARSIDRDLHTDYTAVGQTTHLAAWMEQMAMAGSILITPAVMELVEGYVQVTPLGPVAIRG
jgi:class 3 adenylate cyclase